MPQIIETERLRLVACDAGMLETALRGNDELEALLGAEVPGKWSEFGPAALAYGVEQLSRGEDQTGWWTWLPIHKKDHRLIGSCGFKGKPDADGRVEIGYEIMPAYRNTGLASELAAALVAHAFGMNGVNSVRAHTLDDRNASARVLEKCGFAKVAQIEIPKHGKVWRWEKARP